MVKKIFILFFSLLLTKSNAFCQKFGYVNTDFILSQMTEYQDALNEINTISKSWENEINDMYKNLFCYDYTKRPGADEMLQTYFN